MGGGGFWEIGRGWERMGGDGGDDETERRGRAKGRAEVRGEQRRGRARVLWVEGITAQHCTAYFSPPTHHCAAYFSPPTTAQHTSLPPPLRSILHSAALPFLMDIPSLSPPSAALVSPGLHSIAQLTSPRSYFRCTSLRCTSLRCTPLRCSLLDIPSLSPRLSRPLLPLHIQRPSPAPSVPPQPPAPCNGDGETYFSSVLLKSVRPLLENLAKHLPDGQHKPSRVHVPDAPDVKRPGIGRFGGKPAAAVLAPAVVTAAAAAVTPSAVAAPVAPVASTTPQVPEASVTTEAISEEASAGTADQREQKARWDKLRQDVLAMDVEMTKLRARAAYLRWAKLDQATWARDIEAAIEACLPAWIAPAKTVPPVSATAATVAESAAPVAPSRAAATTVKLPAATSPVRGSSAAAKQSRPAVAARCKVGGETVKGKNGCSGKAVSTGVKGGNISSNAAVSGPRAAAAFVAGSRGGASSVRAGGKASSRQASGVKRREGVGCGEGAAGRAAGGRQGGVKAAGGRAVASGVCGREGVKQQAGRREGLVHERQAKPGCSSSSSRTHRRSS
ncbi:unnamed protein product [Closterium sp. Naga37s-1]|nr:unnamed protein product [Closterium sp. Naga37s-1]